MNNKIAVIAHNIRSVHNIGSVLRTCDGLGAGPVYLTGYTPYPRTKNDPRLPHLSQKAEKQIHKTALGAENTVEWHRLETAEAAINELRVKGYKIVALEQSENSTKLTDFIPGEKTAILLGSEVEGVDINLLNIVDEIIEIPMLGSKESFNVVEAATMAIFHCRYSR